jgi:Cu-Zn family superoxide dismutase
MRQCRLVAALCAVCVLAAGAPAALADDGDGRGPAPGFGSSIGPTILFGMPEDPGISDGNPEGVAFDRRTGSVFVSRTATGAIYRGALADPAAGVRPFIKGIAPRGDDLPQAAGLKVRDGRLYVAGGATGTIKVYDLAAGTLLATFDTRGADPTLPTFVNDLVVTEDGDVFATDSFRARIYHVSADAVAAGTGDVTPIALDRDIPNVPGAFNLNGIEDQGNDLIVVQSETGQLFRVTPDDDSTTARVREIQVDGGLKGGDGLLLDRGRLLVVQGQAPGFPNGVVTVVKLRGGRTRGQVEARVTDDTLAGPSTIARARDRYLVVNAHFGFPPPYTVSGLARDAGGEG